MHRFIKNAFLRSANSLRDIAKTLSDAWNQTPKGDHFEQPTKATLAVGRMLNNSKSPNTTIRYGDVIGVRIYFKSAKGKPYIFTNESEAGLRMALQTTQCSDTTLRQGEFIGVKFCFEGTPEVYIERISKEMERRLSNNTDTPEP